MKYFIYVINCLLLIIIPVAFVFTPIAPQTGVSKTSVETKMLKSVVIKSNKDNKKEDKKVTKEEKKEETKEEKNQDVKKEEAKEVKQQEVPKKRVVTKQPVKQTQPKVVSKPVQKKPITDVLETVKGKMSGYGPDCKGCSGRLASGINAKNGNIYYNDKKYGKIRIVAGDRKYKFGTIVRIKNSKAGNNIIAIVLDRGSSIGIGKKFLFDLLYASEKDAKKYEVSYNVTFEILRYGY